MVKPYNQTESKKEQVALMFNNIAHKYDFLNHFLSFGIDKCWRKKAIKEVSTINPSRILDIATGTGDLAFAACKLKPEEIIGIDISIEMLAIAQTKLKKCNKKTSVRFEQGDSENIHFPDQSFHAVMVAFGVRNFEDLNKGLAEIYRVLKYGGKLVVLEFSRPHNPIFKKIYNFYFFKIVPFFGKLFSKDKRAYSYLPESVNSFPDGDKFLDLMAKAGLKTLKCRRLTFGIACLYSGVKE